MARTTAHAAGDRRASILTASEALFARRGFEATSMADIVAASGVATGTVYRYFENKDAVVMAVSEAVTGVRFDETAVDPVPLGEAIDVLLAAAADQRRGQLSAQVWAKAVDSARLRSMIAQRHEHVCRWLARAIEPGTIEPGAAALQRAEVVVCAVSGLQERLACGVEIELSSFRAALLALLT